VDAGIDAVHLKRYSSRGGMLPLPTARRDDLSSQVRGACLDPWLNVIVRADGTVVPCCADFNGQLVLGALGSQTLAEIWDSPPVVALRTAHITGRDLPYICRQCNDKRTLEDCESVARFLGVPGDVEELRILLDRHPRHLMFEVREDAQSQAYAPPGTS
jgi:radical SAM protein with 4Fe4S-binding SPASM domain